MNCNDVFAWACADAESITTEECVDLFKEINKDKKWGDTVWICKKRNLKPQGPIIKDMKIDGSWTDEMEALPNNSV